MTPAGRRSKTPIDTHPHTCQSCGVLWECDANNPHTGQEDLDCRYYSFVLCPDCEAYLDGNARRSKDGRLS